MQMNKTDPPLFYPQPVEAKNYVDSEVIHTYREKSANLKKKYSTGYNVYNLLIKTKFTFLIIYLYWNTKN